MSGGGRQSSPQQDCITQCLLGDLCTNPYYHLVLREQSAHKDYQDYANAKQGFWVDVDMMLDKRRQELKHAPPQTEQNDQAVKDITGNTKRRLQLKGLFS